MPTHWRSCIESEFLTAADLMDDSGKYFEVTCEVVRWRRGDVRDDDNKKKEKWFLAFEPVSECPPRIAERIRRKEYGGNSTNSQVMESIVGSPFMERWIGEWVTLYVALKVRSKKGRVDAIRFREEKPARPTAKGSGPTPPQQGQQGGGADRRPPAQPPQRPSSPPTPGAPRGGDPRFDDVPPPSDEGGGRGTR